MQSLWIQVTRVNRHGDQEVPPLELNVTAALAHLTEAAFFERDDDLVRPENRQFRHKRVQLRQL